MWRPEEIWADIDSHILEELCARLAAASEVEAGRIEVDVRDREVILEGTTRDERMTRAIMMCVFSPRRCRRRMMRLASCALRA